MTQAECALVLGIDSATLHRPLREMAEIGLISADPAGGGKGARYRLVDEARDELDDAVELGQPMGWLFPGQRLWRVSRMRSLDLAAALAPGRLSRTITWVAELGGGAELLLAIDSQQQRGATDAVRAALEAKGARCQPIQVSELFSGAGFRRYLDGLRHADR